MGLYRATETCLHALSDSASHLTDPDALRVFLVLLMNPIHGLPKVGDVFMRLCRCICALPSNAQGMLLHWIAADVPAELFASRMVRRKWWVALVLTLSQPCHSCNAGAPSAKAPGPCHGNVCRPLCPSHFMALHVALPQ